MKIIKNQTTSITLLAFTFLLLFILCDTVSAADDPTLNVTIGSWNDTGLDSNNVNVGPNQTLVQVRVHNNDTTTAENVNVNFNWFGTANPYINLATNESTMKNLGTILPGEIKDVFFLVTINRNTAAFGTSRNYQVIIEGSNTPQYTLTDTINVLKLISQNRNRINSITVSNPNPAPGEYFTVTVNAQTASATYDIVNIPLINYNPNSIQPINLTTTYGSKTTNNIKIVNPSTTNFISVWTFLAVGEGSQRILAYVHDQSGASEHYNSDYGDITVLINVTKKADLAILKTVCDCNTNVGQNIHFYLSVTNNGPNNATGVVVSDNLPNQVTFLSATPPQVYCCGKSVNMEHW